MTCLIVGAFLAKSIPVANLMTMPGLWRTAKPAVADTGKVYNRQLKTKTAKEELFRESGIGMTDIFKSVVRTAGSNLDDNLQVVAYNKEEITKLLETFRPQVLCTSRLLKRNLEKCFRLSLRVDVLPSPSPRYFRLQLIKKHALYKQKLPALNP
jgi:G:T/U-mismatch repair DNA glycosylase